MSFEHPWLVWGALTALIPVAIHLINRQRAPVVRFAALEHLLLSDKRLSQSLKVRQLLVLLLRMALLGLLALALAKPSWDEEVSATQGMLGPGAVAIIIDDSLSMNARPREGDQTLLERAIEGAEERIASGGHRRALPSSPLGERRDSSPLQRPLTERRSPGPSGMFNQAPEERISSPPFARLNVSSQRRGRRSDGS